MRKSSRFFAASPRSESPRSESAWSSSPRSLPPRSAAPSSGRAAPPRARAVLLAAGLAALLTGCGATRPLYSGFWFDSPTLVETDRSQMVRYLDWVIKSERLKRITVITPDKGAQSLLPRDASSPDTTDWLPLPALFAARYILNPRLKGLEVDLLAKTEEDGFTPVSAVHDLDGSVRIEVGLPVKSIVPPPESLPSREELSRRYALRSVRDGQQAWRPLELHSLAQSLDLLTEPEREVIRGVSFVRHVRAQQSAKGMKPDQIWGQYRGKIDKGSAADAREILLFDTEVGHDTSLFIGEPSRFYPIPVMCLLHEIGHAIADYARVRAARTSNRLIDEYKQHIDTWNSLRAAGQLSTERAAELQRHLDSIEEAKARQQSLVQSIREQYKREDGPVLAAYRAARGTDRGPTPYGRKDIEESFAESFALYKADPGALRRVYPGLYEWFAAGHHIKALEVALRTNLSPPAGAEQPAQVAATALRTVQAP